MFSNSDNNSTGDFRTAAKPKYSNSQSSIFNSQFHILSILSIPVHHISPCSLPLQLREFLWIGHGLRSGPLSKGSGLRRKTIFFREGTDPEDNPAASAAPGRSSLGVLCVSVVKHNLVNPVNPVKNNLRQSAQSADIACRHLCPKAYIPHPFTRDRRPATSDLFYPLPATTRLATSDLSCPILPPISRQSNLTIKKVTRISSSHITP
jgi:hypothetical protein